VVGLFLIVFFGSWAGYEAFSANHPTPVVVSPITPVVVSQNNDKQITADSVEAPPGTSSTITFKLELSTLDNSTQEIRPLLTKEMDQLIASKVLETSVASVLGIEPTAVDVGSSRKTMPSSRKLQAEDPSSVQCASNYGTSSICCGQAGTPSTPVNQCPSNYPECTDYVLDSHWGTCVSAETKKPMPSKITVAAYCLNHVAGLNTCKSLVASPEFATVLQNDIRTRCAPLFWKYVLIEMMPY